MYAININVYEAYAALPSNQAGRPSKNKGLIYGPLLFRLMYFGKTRKIAEKNYIKYGDKLVRSLLATKKFLVRSFWTEQSQISKEL